MKRCAALATILAASPCFAQTARDYYNEIYAAGGLDRAAARYVCFNEDPDVKAFLVFTESKYLREHMISNGQFDKLSKAEQAALRKEALIFRGYDKDSPPVVKRFSIRKKNIFLMGTLSPNPWDLALFFADIIIGFLTWSDGI